jgi:Cof subfamily protein (haloacid dehalogenase superfamily)
MIKLIVSDLDGTLLTKFKSVSKENQEALIEAQKQGCILALATGRGFDSTHQFVPLLKMDQYNGYMVVNNGQRLIDIKNNKTTINGYITVDAARKVLAFAQKHHLQFVMDGEKGFAFYSPKNLRIYRDIYRFLIKILPHFRPILGRIHIFSLFGFLKTQEVKIINNAEDIIDNYDKIGLAHTKISLDKSMQELLEAFEEHFEVMRVSDNWIDISPKGLTKLVGIRQIMEMHGINDDEVLTMGDSDNDVTMISAFPNGVAMGNANDRIKSIAKHMTKSNSENGVAHAVNKFVLNK